MYQLTPVVPITIVCGAVGAQQPAKPFVTPASASDKAVRRSNLSLAEQMRRRPDILTNEVLAVAPYSPFIATIGSVFAARCREIARDDRRQREHNRHGDEGRRVGRRRVEEHTANDTRRDNKVPLAHLAFDFGGSHTKCGFFV